MRLRTALTHVATASIAFTAFASHATAQDQPTSGPAVSESLPKTLPPQPRPSLDPLIAPDPLAPIFDPWNDLKVKAEQDLGLRVEGSYTFHYQYADKVATGRHDEFGGRMDFGGLWTLYRSPNGKDTGSVGFLLRSSENIGMSQDFAVSDNVGSLLGTNSLHGGGEQIPVSLNLLYWRQTFLEEKLVLYVGKLHPNAYIDLSTMANDETKQFMSGGYTGNLSNPQHGAWAPGVALEYNLTDQWYVHGVGVNGEGRTGTSGLNNLDEGHFYGAGEVGYRTGKPGGPQGNYRITGWYNNREEGHGFGASVGFDQELADGWTPFGRYGYGDPDATNIEHFAMLGIANVRPFGRRGDMFGLAGTWSRPSDRSLREEQVYEAFYRIRLTDTLELSPDIQWVVNPAFQPNESSTLVFGLRLKVLF